MTTAADFRPVIDRLVAEACASAFPAAPGDALPVGLYDRIVDIAVTALIVELLERNGGNQTWTARELGINRNTLHKLMRRHGLVIHGYPLAARRGRFTAERPTFGLPSPDRGEGLGVRSGGEA